MTIRTASCSCGQLTARVSAEPLRVSVCHCLACQRRSGSVFAAQARFAAGAVAIRGKATVFARTGDAGSTAYFHFCPLCGATVYWTNATLPDAVTIPVGAFADPAFPPPSLSIYEERAHPWVRMADGIVHVD